MCLDELPQILQRDGRDGMIKKSRALGLDQFVRGGKQQKIPRVQTSKIRIHSAHCDISNLVS